MAPRAGEPGEVTELSADTQRECPEVVPTPEPLRNRNLDFGTEPEPEHRLAPRPSPAEGGGCGGVVR